MDLLVEKYPFFSPTFSTIVSFEALQGVLPGI